jgi:hypothetical protein
MWWQGWELSGGVLPPLPLQFLQLVPCQKQQGSCLRIERGACARAWALYLKLCSSCAPPASACRHSGFELPRSSSCRASYLHGPRAQSRSAHLFASKPCPCAAYIDRKSALQVRRSPHWQLATCRSHPDSPSCAAQGFVYLKFETQEAAQAAAQALHGRWYSGHQIVAEFQFTQIYAAYFKV